MVRLSTQRSARPPTADVVLATCLVLFGQLEVWLLSAVDAPVTAPLVLLSALALAWRRRAPLGSFTVVLAVQAVLIVSGVPIDALNVFILVWAIASYSMAAHASTLRAVVGLAMAVVGVSAGVFATGGPGAENLLFGLIVAAAPWVVGRLVRLRTEQAVVLALRSQEIELHQAEREQAAVAGERVRIARELHDVITHAMSGIVIQAGVEARTVASRDAEAAAVLADIERAGREVLVELRRLLGVLHTTPGEQLTPQPSLCNLDGLLDPLRRAGMDVSLRVDGNLDALPPGVDLSAYRIVQEALTNVLKHADARTATVHVQRRNGHVHLEISDDGSGSAARRDAAAAGAAHGLIGMRERARLCGGDLHAGPADPAGFRVTSRLPIDGRPT
jgi:signal transduction histidine kinase